MVLAYIIRPYVNPTRSTNTNIKSLYYAKYIDRIRKGGESLTYTEGTVLDLRYKERAVQHLLELDLLGTRTES